MYEEDESYFESYIKLCTSVGQHENIIKFYGISVVKGWYFNAKVFLLIDRLICLAVERDVIPQKVLPLQFTKTWTKGSIFIHILIEFSRNAQS